MTSDIAIHERGIDELLQENAERVYARWIIVEQESGQEFLALKRWLHNLFVRIGERKRATFRIPQCLQKYYGFKTQFIRIDGQTVTRVLSGGRRSKHLSEMLFTIEQL